MGTEGRALSWVESLSAELPRLWPPLPLGHAHSESARSSGGLAHWDGLAGYRPEDSTKGKELENLRLVALA